MCDITITSAERIQDTFVVRGTSDCNEISVQSVTVPTTLIVTPVIDGVWVVTFTSAEIQDNRSLVCGGFCKIDVWCVDDPTCGGGFEALIECPDNECPGVVLELLDLSPCNDSGERTATFRITVTNAPSGMVYELNYGDNEDDTVVFDSSNNPIQLQHDYASGSFDAFVRIVLPADCPNSTSVNVEVSCDGDCPTVTGSVDPDGSCVDNERQVTFTLDFVPSLPVGSSLEIFWSYDGGTDIQTIEVQDNELPSHTHNHLYPSGTFNPTAFVTVTRPGGEECDPVSIEFGPMTVQAGCSDEVTCPTVTLDEVQVQGCAPEEPFVVFTAQVNPPPPVEPAPEFSWKLTAPSGQEFTRTTTEPTVDTRDLWILIETNNSVNQINLNTPGAYAIAVAANIPNTQVDCRPEDTRTFVVEACPECPVVVIDEPEVTGCVPGQATVTFNASVSPGGTSVSEYQWAVSFQGSESATLTTITSRASSEDSWTISDGSSGSIQNHLTAVNDVSVTAIIDDLPENCSTPTNMRQFAIETCVDNPPPRTPTCDACCIWFIANIIAIIATIIAVIVAGCVFNWVEPISMTIAISLAIVTLISVILWGIFCLLRNPVAPSCGPLVLLIEILDWAETFSGLITIALASAGQLPCAIAFAIDWAFIAIIKKILKIFAQLTGCLPPPFDI